jgi:HsdM N-terminal domain
MAIKKSDLYSSLWASCDELRGGMDASQYKDYVLFMHGIQGGFCKKVVLVRMRSCVRPTCAAP